VKARVEQEKLYILFSQVENIEYCELGSEQFLAWEAVGKVPDNPSPYYLALVLGKRNFCVTMESIRESYQTWEWAGTSQYLQDWKDNLWVLPHLIPWKSWELSKISSEIE
jgi:hypothetical protein